MNHKAVTSPRRFLYQFPQRPQPIRNSRRHGRGNAPGLVTQAKVVSQFGFCRAQPATEPISQASALVIHPNPMGSNAMPCPGLGSAWSM